jgi:hypothetical protein
MTQVIRHCPDCGPDRLFEQYHAAAGHCPDSPDGDCPEWFCTDCGAAVLTGLNSTLRNAAEALESRSRVA